MTFAVFGGSVMENPTGQAEGNATVWIFNMKNRFGWADKTNTNVRQRWGQRIHLRI